MTTSNVGVDPDNAPGDMVALENALKTATKKPESAQKPAEQKTQNESVVTKPDWIQDKFWTGNLEESTRKQAESYPQLQSAYGRMANDLGIQRKWTDQVLALDKRSKDLNGTPETAKKPPAVNPRDLVDKPTETLDAYWKQREADLRAEMEQKQALELAQRAEQDFLNKHTDFAEVTATSEFVSWVTSSPLRKRAAALAGQGNYVVADELLTEYKAVKGQAPASAGDSNRGHGQETEAARKASLESAAQAGTVSGAKGQIYRRADLIQLKMTKPQVYSDPSFQAEILRAYAEGRVK